MFTVSPAVTINKLSTPMIRRINGCLTRMGFLLREPSTSQTANDSCDHMRGLGASVVIVVHTRDDRGGPPLLLPVSIPRVEKSPTHFEDPFSEPARVPHALHRDDRALSKLSPRAQI